MTTRIVYFNSVQEQIFKLPQFIACQVYDLLTILFTLRWNYAPHVPQFVVIKIPLEQCKTNVKPSNNINLISAKGRNWHQIKSQTTSTRTIKNAIKISNQLPGKRNDRIRGVAQYLFGRRMCRKNGDNFHPCVRSGGRYLYCAVSVVKIRAERGIRAETLGFLSGLAAYVCAHFRIVAFASVHSYKFLGRYRCNPEGKVGFCRLSRSDTRHTQNDGAAFEWSTRHVVNSKTWKVMFLAQDGENFIKFIPLLER